METIKVYRYEHSNGRGPYRKEFDISNILGEAHHDYDTYPSWCSDFNEQYAKEYVSGCDSIVKLNSWFKGFKLDLHKEGFRVKTYLIPKENVEYGKSNKQLRFKK